MKTFFSVHEAYQAVLHDVYFNPDYRSAPRGLPIREKIDYSFRILDPTTQTIITKDPERNKIIADYTAKEMELYNSGSNLAEDFGKASKFWLKLANPDGTINSAYGHLIWKKESHGNPSMEFMAHPGEETKTPFALRTPWEWCVESLKSDPDTRQAVMRFSLPEHFWVGNKDQVCTLHGNWLIRGNRLHLSIVMRSQDMVKGAVYDWPWFCSLMDKMLSELQSTYPNLDKGYYTHIVHSIHIYDRDEETVKKMLGLA